MNELDDSTPLNLSESDQSINNESDESINNESDHSINNPSKKINKKYKCILEYNNSTLALERIKEPICDETYRFRYKRKHVTGDKHFYFCHGNQNCPKSLYILFHSDSLITSIWLASCTHFHKSKKPAVLPPKSIAHINKLYEEKTRWTNNEIIASLRK